MSIENKISKNNYGWWWPVDDGQGLPGRSCWEYMQKYPLVPTQISEHVENKNVVVQAGGNCGFYVKQYAKLFKQVYTFEPDPINFFALVLNVPESNVHKFQSCLGDEHKLVSLKNDLPDIGANYVSGSGEIPTLRIDDLALTDCNLIHLDVEGFELPVLKGAINTIEKFKPIIAFEWFAPWGARFGTTAEIMDDFLKSIGYEYKLTVSGDRLYAWTEKTDESL